MTTPEVQGAVERVTAELAKSATLAHEFGGKPLRTMVNDADLTTILAALSEANERASILQTALHERTAERDEARKALASPPPPKGAGAGTLSIETAPRDCEIDVYVTGSGSRWIENCRWGKPTGANWGDRYGDDQDLPEQWITRAGFALDRRNGVATHWRPADGALGRQDEVAPQPRDEPISSSKGEALPVVITDEMVKLASIAFDEYVATIPPNDEVDTEPCVRAALEAALLSRGEG